MSEAPLAVNPVNPVDLFVERKMSLNELMYALVCGALSLLVALRLSEIITTLSESFFNRFRLGLLWKALANFVFIIVLISLFAFVMRHVMFRTNPSEGRG